ncbi:MAG: (2Fe-2S)-binding protein [Lysobacterales bacterium]
MAVSKLTINESEVVVDLEGDTPLLWLLRDHLGMTGTKFGCGVGQCGACTIHLDGSPARACLVTVSAAKGRSITTIEGLGGDHPVQRSWVANAVPQCGYCQSGQIMSAVALLNKTPDPSDDQIEQAMAGNLCRCGTYPKIARAIGQAAKIKLRTTKV